MPFYRTATSFFTVCFVFRIFKKYKLLPQRGLLRLARSLSLSLPVHSHRVSRVHICRGGRSSCPSYHETNEQAYETTQNHTLMLIVLGSTVMNTL